MTRLLAPLVALLCLASPVLAEEAWEADVRRAEEEADREISQARQRGTTRALVAKYSSRLARNPTALNHYLLAKATYHDGDLTVAERHLNETLRLEPRFWFAHLKLGILELQRERLPEAERHLRQVLQVHRDNVEALKILYRLHVAARDWDRALAALDQLLALHPQDEDVRHDLVLVHVERGDWAAVLREARWLLGRNPRDPEMRWIYAVALLETGDHPKAVLEFQELARKDPTDIRPLEMLRRAYVKLEDRDGLLSVLERMLPLTKDEELAARIREWIERLKAGPEAPPPDTEFPEDPVARLLEDSTDPDPAVRRAALQAWFEADLPAVPKVLIRRVHWDVEPDPVCRMWLHRIMGSLQNEQLAKVVALGLFDPDAEVRGRAAEALAEIQNVSGVLYLWSHLARLDAARVAADPAALGEFNAMRAALARLAGLADSAGGPEAWVPAERAAEVLAEWPAILASPAGVEARLRAIAEMERLEELHPERYLVARVLDVEPEVARAAYQALLRHAERIDPSDADAAAWGRFPRQGEGGLMAAGLPATQEKVRLWWEAWRAADRPEAGR
jgi:Flp pilus assembly protein TadD